MRNTIAKSGVFKGAFVSLLCAGLFLGAMVSPARAATNVISNGDLQIADASGTAPQGWSHGGWGTNNAVFSYPVAGQSGAGDKAAQISITSYTDGDAKWFFNPVPVSAGQFYAFSDSYNSNAQTSLVAQFTLADNSVVFTQLGSVPSSAGAWKTATAEILVPANAVNMTVFHLMQSTGQLAVDNYSLTLSSNQFSQGMVSLTFDDGWSSQYDNALPILNTYGLHGTFYIISQPMLDAAPHDLFVEEKAGITAKSTASSTTWSEIYIDPTASTYRFTDTYSSNVSSNVIVSYTAAGGTAGSMTIGTLPASSSAQQKAEFIFTLPPLQPSTPIAIRHALLPSNTGTFNVSGPTLAAYTDYMNSSQVLPMQSGGNEIGAHTVNHCNLVQLNNDPNSATTTVGCPDGPLPAPSTAASQISNSRSTLLGIGAAPVTSFAYPYGSYNSAVESLVNADGLTSARTVDAGYNSKAADKFALKVQVVDSTVTLNQVETWIDGAVSSKLWLILVFHQVEDQNPITLHNDTPAVTPQMLLGIASYLQSKQVSVLTVHDALALMGSATPPPPTTGSLTVTKNTIGGNGSFSFTGSNSAGNFQITTTNNAGTHTLSNLNPGSYTITESALATGWTQSSSNCANVQVVAGQTASCTITNTFSQVPTTGSLVVTKKTVGNNGTFNFTGTSGIGGFQMATANNVATHTIANLTAGTYSISEGTLAAGWSQTGNTCTNVQVTAGQTATCTITNTYTAPVNHAPVITAPVTASGTVGQLLSFAVTASDADNDPLTWSASLPSGAAFTADTGKFSWTPASATTTSATFMVSDGKATTTKSVIITVSASPVCANLLTTDLTYGGSNPTDQVKKLQTFLNSYEYSYLSVNGRYNILTDLAVRVIQQNNLAVLGLNSANGNASGATRTLINQLNCQLGH